MLRLKTLFFLTFLLCFQSLIAQDKTPEKKPEKVFTDIEKYSKKSKFNEFIYRLLFREQRHSAAVPKKNRKRNILKKSFDKNECKIIRKINIEVLDPFGYSLDNDKDKPQNGLERFGNKVHIKSKKWTIRNYLLFKKNEPLDSLIVKESERLIRTQRYVRSVNIQPVEIPNSKDSVDVTVRVLDSWSLIPTGSIYGTTGELDVTETNFLGLGHEVENDYIKGLSNMPYGYRARYSINNIKNTFINSSFGYENTINNYTTKSVKIERPFYSALTRWAGGVYFESKFYRDSLPTNPNQIQNQIQNFQYNTNENWLGHSFKLFNGKQEDFRTTNLITTVGYKNVAYLQNPIESVDPSGYFSNEKLILGSISLNTRKFIEDKYLYNFGVIEDIPFGQVYSVTSGAQYKNNLKRGYFGGRFAYGYYFPFGYLGTNVQWGSFFNNGLTQETTFKFDTYYFTNLQYLGDWKLRQFLKTGLVVGNNRAPLIKDRVTLSDDNSITGFTNPLVNGTKKLTFSFQTQTYAPGLWYGFHFSPFFNMTYSFLGNEQNSFLSDKLYSKFSIGVLINNDYLVFNSFQISFSFYPSIPYEGANIIKTNAYNNNDLALPNFQIGKPSIVPFR